MTLRSLLMALRWQRKCALIALGPLPCQVIAICTNAMLIGTATMTLNRLYAYDNAEHQAREAVTAYLSKHAVPAELQKRIHAFYDFLGGVARHRTKLLPHLPKGLEFELEIFLKRDLFLKVPFFKQVRAKRTTPPGGTMRDGA